MLQTRITKVNGELYIVVSLSYTSSVFMFSKMSDIPSWQFLKTECEVDK